MPNMMRVEDRLGNQFLYDKAEADEKGLLTVHGWKEVPNPAPRETSAESQRRAMDEAQVERERRSAALRGAAVNSSEIEDLRRQVAELTAIVQGLKPATDGPDFDKMTLPELRDHAHQHSIDLTDASGKADVIDRIKAAPKE